MDVWTELLSVKIISQLEVILRLNYSNLCVLKHLREMV